MPNEKALGHTNSKRHTTEGAQKLCRPLALRSRGVLTLPVILNRCKDSKDFGNLQRKSAQSDAI